MLKTLTVNNFALIEHAGVEFAPGLNILTGETGAGKSILIDALNTVLGSRATVDSIRGGSGFFRVEAVFDVETNPAARQLLDDQGIPLEDGSTLIVSRNLSRSGKTTITVNGCHVTVGSLRQLGAVLVDMHGQHENQALLKPDAYLRMIDAFDPAIKPRLENYRGIYGEWTALNTEIARLETSSRERAQRLDMLQWQTGEIAAANLVPGEEETLDKEIRVLANAEKIATAVARSHSLLSGGDRGGSVISGLAEIKKDLELAARFEPALENSLKAAAEALYQLEEVAADLRDYGEKTEFHPDRLAELQERLDTLHKLKRKYGASVDEVLAYYDQACAELAGITNYDQRLAGLAGRRAELEAKLAAAAGELDKLRRTAAADLARQVAGHLADLGMPKARLVVEVQTTERYNAAGSNEAAFLFSANPGEPPRPLQKVASGGELSRIALAIKTVAASRDEAGTMVFDEIDAGIGGQTALMVAEKIAMAAADKQVLCITHLPQIAAMADRHLSVEKKSAGERTTTIVRILDGDSRLEEVTRMVSGDNITRLALDNAREMIAAAQSKKEKWKNRAQA